jgi:hypothetical protein
MYSVKKSAIWKSGYGYKPQDSTREDAWNVKVATQIVTVSSLSQQPVSIQQPASLKGTLHYCFLLLPLYKGLSHHHTAP